MCIEKTRGSVLRNNSFYDILIEDIGSSEGRNMNVYVCLDEKNGMMFNKRRQSRDARLTEKVIEMAAGGRLLINSYSKTLFGDSAFVDDAFLDNAQSGDHCFVENVSLADYEEKINTLTIFKWNRVYPADMYFDIHLSGWKMESAFDFEGNSHEKITGEVWVK